MRKASSTQIHKLLPALALLGLGQAVCSAQNFYVSASSQRYISQVSANGTLLPNLASFTSPANTSGLAVDTLGNVYVGSPDNNTIYQVTAEGVVTTYATGLPNNLSGLAFDSTGTLYAGEANNNGYGIGIISGGGFNPINMDNPDATYSAGGLTFDSAGNLYVANTSRYGPNPDSVVKLTRPAEPDGVWTSSVFASFAQDSNPVGLDFDDSGNLYVAFYSTSQLLKLLPDGSTDLGFNASGLTNPTDVVFVDGDLYVTDAASHSIKMVTLDGTVSTFSVLNDTPAFIAYSAIPEPGTVAMLVLGGAGLIAMRLRKSRKQA